MIGVTIEPVDGTEPAEAPRSVPTPPPDETVQMGRWERKPPPWWDGETAADVEAAQVIQTLGKR